MAAVHHMSFVDPMAYQIKVRGTITDSLLQAVDDMQIRVSDHENLINLVGWLPDQSALLGVLNALHQIHYPIVSVQVLTEPSMLTSGQGDERKKS